MSVRATEHGVLFSDEFVRALLDGRKTQTRRLVLPTNSTVNGHGARSRFWRSWWETAHFEQAVPTQETAEALHVRCGGELEETLAVYRVRPLVEAGDRIWVREAFHVDVDLQRAQLLSGDPTRRSVFYRATDGLAAPESDWKWRPSMHMPRWASRLELDVESVRAERLRELTEDDAAAEGVRSHVGAVVVNGAPGTGFVSARYVFASAWDRLHPHATFATNPWVWVTSFRKRRTVS